MQLVRAVALDGIAFSCAWFDLIFYRNVLYRCVAQEQEPVPDCPGVGEAVTSGLVSTHDKIP